MDDPLRDPRYPDRPQHPSFWRLAEIVLEMDATVTSTGKVSEIVHRSGMDTRSLVYMSNQRALRLLDNSPSTSLRVLIATAWTEGFIAGTRFAKRYPNQEEDQG